MQSASVALCCTRSAPLLNSTSVKQFQMFSSRMLFEGRASITFTADNQKKRNSLSISDTSARLLISHRDPKASTVAAASGGGDSVSELDDGVRKLLRVFLWIAEGIYIVWLFLLPYAPGDPVWAISSDTINSLIGLSLNFFFILPLLNSE